MDVIEESIPPSIEGNSFLIADLQRAAREAPIEKSIALGRRISGHRRFINWARQRQQSVEGGAL